MERLRFLARRLNVEIFQAPIASHACLTHRYRRPSLILISSDAPAERRLPAAATLLHVVALGWPERQHRLMFELPGGDMNPRSVLHRREYRMPYRLGLRTLMPDSWLERQEREETDARAAAAEAGVSVTDYVFRVADWQVERERRIKPDLADMIAAGLIKRGSEIGPPAPKPVPPVVRVRAQIPRDRPLTWQEITALYEAQTRRRMGLPLPAARPAAAPPERGPEHNCYEGIDGAQQAAPAPVNPRDRHRWRGELYAWMAEVRQERAGYGS